MTMHWSVAQIYSKRAHLIRRDVGSLGHRIECPTYIKVSYPDGKLSRAMRELFPCYLIFQTEPDGWGGVSATEGVIRVLGSGVQAMKDDAVDRLAEDSRQGKFDDIGRAPDEPQQQQRASSRQPRMSKRIKRRAARAAAWRAA